MLKEIKILGVKISVVNLRRACLFVEECITQKKKTYVCVAPVSTIIDCQQDKKYCDIVNSAGMVTPDGMPLVWLGKLKGEKDIERTYGPDFMLSFCEVSQQKGYQHFFYGGMPETNSLLAQKLQSRFPKLKIAGCHAPALQPCGTIEQEIIIDQINKSNVDVVWVGLGSPKQDYWMYNHREKLKAPVIIGVGAAFDFIAGVKPQAPLWMRQSGLEWLFRLCCEPKRLWKRYLIGNALFIYLLAKNLIRKDF